MHNFEPDSNYYNYCEFAKSPFRNSNERVTVNQQNQNLDSKNEQNFSMDNSEYKIIPNPNLGNFSLLCYSSLPILCELIDLSGRLIFSRKYSPVENRVQFHLSHLPKGVYNLRVVDDNKVSVLKILIN